MLAFTRPVPDSIVECELTHVERQPIDVQKARRQHAEYARTLQALGGVKPETAEKVIVAAKALDYPRRLPEIHRGLIRIEVIMVRPETGFYQRLGRSFERIAAI